MLVGVVSSLVLDACGAGRDGDSTPTTPARCRATAFVTNGGSGTVSTINVKTRTKNPTDITVGTDPIEVAVTPCHR
jgi:YVTN family beta-propeller protein